jgi:hypothetical protein
MGDGRGVSRSGSDFGYIPVDAVANVSSQCTGRAGLQIAMVEKAILVFFPMDATAPRAAQAEVEGTDLGVLDDVGQGREVDVASGLHGLDSERGSQVDLAGAGRPQKVNYFGAVGEGQFRPAQDAFLSSEG